MASLKSLQKRYDRSLASDDFYGAEQACRMMHHRLTQGKNSTDSDKQQAYDILLSGSKTLLDKEQPHAGAALGLLLVKHCVDYKVAVSDSSISQLTSISDAFGTPDDEGERERLRFLKAALAWSSTKGGSILGATVHGHAKLNTLVGHSAAKVGDHTLSQRCFIHSDDPIGFAKVLHSFASENALPGESALVLTRSILRYLLSENLGDAIVLRTQFAKLSQWPDVESPSQGSSKPPPLAHFCELLLKIVRLDASAASLYKRMCDAYNSQLSRDPSFANQLSQIGQMYFNIQPPQPSGLAGMMGTMLRGMMNPNN